MSEDRSIPISPAALEAFAAGAAFMPQSAPGPSADNEARSAEDATGSSGSCQSEEASETEQNNEAPVEETINSSGDALSEAVEETPAPPTDPRFPISVLPGFCTRLAGSTCERCTFVCPYDAIFFDEQDRPLIDEEFCTRCGLCCGICDAFVTERITMNDLLDKVRRLSGEGEPVFFTCYDQIPEDFEVHPNVVVLPCIRAVASNSMSALQPKPQLQICRSFLIARCRRGRGEGTAHACSESVKRWSRITMSQTDAFPKRPIS